MEIKLDELTIDPEVQLAERGTNQLVVSGYVEAMAAGSEFPPIVVFRDNSTFWLSDGFHRVAAYKFLGYDVAEADVFDGDRREATLYAATANVTNGRPMSQAEKREAGRRMIEMTDWSDSEIARRLAVTHTSVQRWRDSLSCTYVQDSTRTVTRGGTTYEMDVSNIGSRDEPQQPNVFYDNTPVHSPLSEASPIKTGASQPVEVTIFSHSSVEYYTPPQFIEAARQVMGDIDLDPASCADAQEWIQASEYYTEDDDGLAHEWYGRIWLNPPYSKTGGQSNQELWSQRLIHEYESGNIDEAILLVKAALGYNWFENLWYDWPVCFVRERLSFIKSDGSDEGQSKQGTALLYFGPNRTRFRDVFGQFGRVIFPEEGYYASDEDERFTHAMFDSHSHAEE